MKARVAALEEGRGDVLLYDQKMDRASKDRLLGTAPRVGADAGGLGLDHHSQEVLWLFVRDKLKAEQESGEHPCSPSFAPAGGWGRGWDLGAGSRGRGTGLAIPSDCWERRPGGPVRRLPQVTQPAPLGVWVLVPTTAHLVCVRVCACM